jgi:hypothetical protein
MLSTSYFGDILIAFEAVLGGQAWFKVCQPVEMIRIDPPFSPSSEMPLTMDHLPQSNET